MIIKQKKNEKWVCRLTERLDNYLVGKTNIWYTYIYIISENDKHNCLALRVPGQTIGRVMLDENDCIVSIGIDDLSIAKFNCDINELVKDFVGVGVSYEEEV